MKSSFSIIRTTMFVLFLALASNAGAQGVEPIKIFDPKSTTTESIRAQDVQLTRLEDGSLAIKNGLNDQWPGVHFTGEWNLGEYSALALTIRSTSDEDIALFCRVDCADVNMQTLEGSTTEHEIFKPGERRVWTVYLPKKLNVETRAKLFGMRGKPGRIFTNSDSEDQSIVFDKNAVIAVRPFEPQNGRADSWVLESIEAIPSDAADVEQNKYLQLSPEEFFPMLDEFGQFKHTDWKGKTHSLEELRAQIAIEDADLDAHRCPESFDEFGGWLDGPQFEATGSFRTEKIDGFWYLVDPIGRLFWSHGVDSVADWSAVTPVSEREFYFDPSTPTRPDGSVFAQFLSECDGAIHNYLEGKGKYWQYNLSAANLYRKYGDDWREKIKKRIARRFRSWGLNTYGNWSDPGLYLGVETPYVGTANSGGRAIEGSSGYWGKFVDPFDPSFAETVRRSLGSLQKNTADDPYCVGYFVDNELSWGEAGSLSEAALASPKDQPAKLAYIKWLQDKYETIERLNDAWETNLADWNVLVNEPFESPKTEGVQKDNVEFYEVICDQYFSQIAKIVKEIAPNKLYLGCRFAWTNEVARRSAQKYCDVVSYNSYTDDVDKIVPVEGEDKPIIIGEFHFGALDRGLFHTGLVPRETQEERAESYRIYVESALRNPQFVGTHWFEYSDEATTGRFDGENYQIGLVDVCDVPYAETIDAVRKVGYSMYELRDQARQTSKDAQQ